MKRRDFLSYSVAAAGLSFTGLARSQSLPCPPSPVGIDDTGTRVTTPCTADGLPSWVPDPGRFANVSLNVPRDVHPPSGSPFWGNEGPSGVWQDWTSGAFVSDFGAMGSYLCWGGGHGGYYGNEVYCWDVDTRLWSRLGIPSPYGGDSLRADGSFPDGNPGPPHTYGALATLSAAHGGGPSGSLIQATLPACLPTGNGANAYWWRFDLKSQQWSHFISSSGIERGTTTHAALVQEPNGNFWWRGSGYVTRITRVTPSGQITPYNVSLNSSYTDCGDVVPGQRIAVLVGGVSGSDLWLLNLSAIESGATGRAAAKQIATSGAPARYSWGMRWVPDRRAFGTLDPGNPTQLYWLTPSDPADAWNSNWTWSIETLAGAGGATATPCRNGSWGRFVWVPAIKCFLWSPTGAAPMQAYRPTGT